MNMIDNTLRRLRMAGTSVYFRILFVVFATSGAAMLMYFYQIVPNIAIISETSERLSATRNIQNGVHSSHTKAILGLKQYNAREQSLNSTNGPIEDISVFSTETNEKNGYVKPLPEKSPFIDPKLYLNETIDYKTILWWNVPDWVIPLQQNSDMTQCNYKNCKVSFDKNDLNKSNAVVFSISNRGIQHSPPVPMDKRNPDQAWLFFTLESPIHVKLASTAFLSPHWHNAFNWSWNYRPDSDIFYPYGHLNTKEILPVRNYSEIFRKKTKQVAWLVSHCNAVSNRDDYVRILNKYIPVDIYGGCGEKAPANVTEFISKNYKFYLGFENSLCCNYVTEKFFHYNRLDVINVVRGKTNYSDYFPAHSYINTADYSSIKALGEFLKDLGENEEEYIKYLKIKDMYDVIESSIVYTNAVCHVCDKLNNLEKNRKIYKNVGEWLGTCDKANDLKET